MADPLHRGRTAAKPGAALKALRIRNGWTLAQFSERTGLPVPTLSRIENDKIALSFEKLLRLSEGLQVDISQLIDSTSGRHMDVDGGTRRTITRAGEGKAIEMPRGNYLYLATELLNKRMVPIIGEVLARSLSDYDELLCHPGEEYLYVLEGTLELHTQIYAPTRLEKGDSIYFDSGMPHAYIAIGDKPCRVLSICTTSEAHLIGVLERDAQATAAKTASGQRSRGGKASRRASPKRSAAAK